MYDDCCCCCLCCYCCSFGQEMMEMMMMMFACSVFGWRNFFVLWGRLWYQQKEKFGVWDIINFGFVHTRGNELCSRVCVFSRVVTSFLRTKLPPPSARWENFGASTMGQEAQFRRIVSFGSDAIFQTYRVSIHHHHERRTNTTTRTTECRSAIVFSRTRRSCKIRRKSVMSSGGFLHGESSGVDSRGTHTADATRRTRARCKG